MRLERRTPSMIARNSCVSGSTSEPDPVLRHQEPAAAALFDLVQPVAGHGVRNLRGKGCVVEDEQPPQRAVVGALFLQRLRTHPQPFALHLHHHFVGRGFAAHEGRQAGHALVADGGHLDGVAVAHDVMAETTPRIGK